MAVVTSNGLQGTTGVQPTLTTLGQTGDAPTFLDNTGLVYDDTYLIRTRNSLRLRTNFIRSDTGRLTFPLPTGAWAFRFYMRPEPLADPVDVNEWRYLMDFGSDGAVAVRESSIQGISLWHQPQDLDTPPDLGTESGTHQDWDQLLRIEATYDGSSTLTVRGYTGDTNFFRENTYNISLSTNQITLGGYRYKRHSLLQNGDNDDDLPGTPVEDYQNKLLVWDPNALPNFGADGDFGNETQTATEDFQADVGLPVTGIAGAETQSALDLVVRLDADPNDYPVPLWIGNLAITDTDTFIGTLDPASRSPSTDLDLASSVEAEETTTSAFGTLTFDSTTQTTAAKNDTADATLSFTGQEQVSKAVDTTVSTEVVFEPQALATGESFIPPPPPVPPQARLAVYDPNGGLRGYLPFPLSWDVSFPLNDLGALRFSYSEEAPGYDLISDPPFEIAFEINQGQQSLDYVEYPQSRFISLTRTRDRADRGKVVTWTMPHYGWMLRKARLYDGITTNTNTREFVDRRAAHIWRLIFFESKNRDNLPGMGITFGNTFDSDDNAWDDDPQTVEMSLGADLWSLLQSYTESGIMDWRFDKRVINAYNFSSTMRTTRDVHFDPLSSSIESPEQWSFDQFAQSIISRFDNGRGRLTRSGSTPWGVWTEMLDASGYETSHTNPVFRFASAELDAIDHPRIEQNHRYLLTGTTPIPMAHFLPGDRIRVTLYPEDTGFLGTTQSQTVQSITMSFDADRVIKTNLTFGTRIIPDALRRIDRDDRMNSRARTIMNTWKRDF